MKSRMLIKQIFLSVVATGAGIIVFGCGARLPGSYDTLDYRTESDIATDKQPGVTTAFYATDRLRAGPGNAAEAYGAARGEGLKYGVCDIRVPRVHSIGSDIITEKLSRAEGRPVAEPLTVSATNESSDADDFFTKLIAAVNATPKRDVLIFVHGYNTSFSSPIAHAAGLVYDMGAKMVPVGYAWSSQGTFQGYPSDENDVDFAARQLANFLGTLTARLKTDAPGARLHLIAHSMGSRVATLALARLKAANPAGTAPFQNLVFAAADIDASEFQSRMRDDALTTLASRTTLYAAYNDRALLASDYVHGHHAYPRAGHAGETILVMPGIDTVDVSLNDASFVGHGYIGDNRAVIDDLHMLLMLDQPPQGRNLFHAEKDGQTYWLLRP